MDLNFWQKTMKQMKDCHLNNKGYCECYLKQCNAIGDCTPKLITKRNMLTVEKLINR
jgi:hypothetical protein